MELEKILREAPDNTGNELTLDISMKLWEEHKNRDNKYLSFIMSRFIMPEVHYLRTEER